MQVDNNLSISFLVTSFKEPGTIKQCLNGLLSDSFLETQKKFELLLACPDTETLFQALLFLQSKFELKLKINSLSKQKINKNFNLEISKNFDKLDNIILELFLQNQKIGIFKHIKDPQKGKPFALNLLLTEATAEILILTDGDAIADKDAVIKLLEKQKETKASILSARPVSRDSKSNFWGYIGHLLADSAHLKRLQDKTFPASGYLFLIKVSDLKQQTKLQIPDNILSDDAYISYFFQNQGLQADYQPNAKVYIKYSNNLKDFVNQKRRSLGGFNQLLKLKELNLSKNQRNILEELKYFFFPLKYAKNAKELFYSLFLYPLRLYLWMLIWVDQKVLKKDFKQTWVRIESTK
jgi:cellulose synthase/poly-beta-1,6-N-acetylglucosamine synthase-like glycosyltransferase